MPGSVPFDVSSPSNQPNIMNNWTDPFASPLTCDSVFPSNQPNIMNNWTDPFLGFLSKPRRAGASRKANRREAGAGSPINDNLRIQGVDSGGIFDDT